MYSKDVGLRWGRRLHRSRWWKSPWRLSSKTWIYIDEKSLQWRTIFVQSVSPWRFSVYSFGKLKAIFLIWTFSFIYILTFYIFGNRFNFNFLNINIFIQKIFCEHFKKLVIYYIYTTCQFLNRCLISFMLFNRFPDQ